MEDTMTFEDASIPAFLEATKKQFTITPTLPEGGRQVVFIVKGNPDEIKRAIADMYANAQVGAMDLITAIKKYRSAIFNLRRKAV
jgi:hypothetical protein